MKKLVLAILFFLVILLTSEFVLADNVLNLASIKVPAVTNEGKGVLTEVEVEIISGKGRVLLNTEPFGGVQLQNSERVAANVAQNFTGKNLSEKDIVITFKAKAAVVDGPSAGGAMTIAVISALSGEHLRNDTSLTGTIQPDGSIGPVSSIFEKARAAADTGFTVFLIPRGQELQAFTVEKVEKPAPGFSYVKDVVQYRNITRYAAENWNLTVLQISDIKDVYNIMINGKNITVPAKINAQKPSFLEEVPYGQNINALQRLSKEQIAQAEESLARAKETLSKSKLDSKTLEDALDLLRISERELTSAKTALSSNYLYGAANHGFKATILAKSASDITKFNSLTEQEQQEFLNKRKSEASLFLKKAQQKLSDVELYDNDFGSYEWAISAENRLAQAEEQMDNLKDAENPLSALALVEGWSDISVSLYEISKERATGQHFDKKIFENSSTNSLQSLVEELNKFTLPPGDVVWLTQVSEREFNKHWYSAAHTDSQIALERFSTQRDLNTRDFDDIIKYVQAQIDKTNTKNSAWAELYKEQAKLDLYYVKRDQNIEFLDDALMFVDNAKVYAELAVKVDKTPLEEREVPFVVPPIFVIGGVLVVAVAITYFEFMKMRKKR